jgi:hypothetical protein
MHHILIKYFSSFSWLAVVFYIYTGKIKFTYLKADAAVQFQDSVDEDEDEDEESNDEDETGTGSVDAQEVMNEDALSEAALDNNEEASAFIRHEVPRASCKSVYRAAKKVINPTENRSQFVLNSLVLDWSNGAAIARLESSKIAAQRPCHHPGTIFVLHITVSRSTGN